MCLSITELYLLIQYTRMYKNFLGVGSVSSSLDFYQDQKSNQNCYLVWFLQFVFRFGFSFYFFNIEIGEEMKKKKSRK